MATKKLQILGSLGNKVYSQNEEPIDAPDGSLWVDLDDDVSEETGLSIDDVQNNLDTHISDSDNPHGVTIAQIGAAPSRYGLGAHDTTTISDCNLAVKSGWYKTSSATLNQPMAVGCWMRVDAFNDAWVHQVWYNDADTGEVHRYQENGVWTEWEYENPPLRGEAEYRTTERFYGKPVYCKSFTCGAMPSSGEKSRNHGTIMDDIVRVSARCYFASGDCVSLPISNTVNVHVINSSSIYLWCESGGEQFVNTEVDVYYTKP